MKCQACGTEIMMPFRCPYCGGQFCSVHRIPENHNCPRIGNARAERQEQVMTSQAPNSYSYSYVFGQQPFQRKYRIKFSQKEIKHITVAAALVIGIGFSIGIYGNLSGSFRFLWTWDVLAVFAVIMTASFLVHEIAHKIMAQKSGMWAEFRLTTWGAVLTLISVFMPFKLIAPGAMMIGGQMPSPKNYLKISIAGVIINIIFGAVFLSLAFALPLSVYSGMLLFSAYINSFMALFNLIPLGVLDGYKIFKINKKIWILTFTPAVVLTVILYFLI